MKENKISKLSEEEKIDIICDLCQNLGLDVPIKQLIFDNKELDEDQELKKLYKKLNWRQKAFVAAYKTCLGNKSKACISIKVSPNTYYWWYNNHDHFRNYMNSIDIDKVRGDFYEAALDERVQQGDTTAIIFGLKTKYKNRGYSELPDAPPPTENEEFIFYMPDNGRPVLDISHEEVKKED